MGNPKQRLELTWIGKDERPRLEPRILVEEAERSYHAEHRVSDGDLFDNRLIFGDNLLALKALEQEFAGQVKCIYIDPPYNTGSAFTHYDDGVEHSLWLSLMRDRLELLRRLLREDGSLWVNIDDAEGHYLKVLLDEIFGRLNFAGTVTWQKTTSVHNNATLFSSATDMLLLYVKDVSKFKMGRVTRSERNISDYGNPDNDPLGPWTSSPLHVSLTSGQRGKQFAATGKSSGLFGIRNPHGEHIYPPKGRCWGYSEATIAELQNAGKIWWGKSGRNQPRLKRYLKESAVGTVPTTLWLSSEVGHNQEAKAETSLLLSRDEELFSTPKPERLLQRILALSTNPGDLVLDSFAGSGTTGAVAHKMGRRWIMIELGEHCHTHIIPRLRKVIDGEDQGGISKDVNWKGGGGFRYYRLAPSLLTKDKYGNWVINKEYNPAQLAEAVCKHAGFTYKPSDVHYWQHGQSTERDFIYVTTQSLTRAQLEILSDEVGPEQSLLVYCAAFEGKENDFPNLTVKKIPKSILRKCEWGKDDYSLKIENLPGAPPPMDGDQMLLLEEAAEYKTTPPAKRKSAKKDDLFDDAESGDGNAE